LKTWESELRKVWGILLELKLRVKDLEKETRKLSKQLAEKTDTSKAVSDGGASLDMEKAMW
jgi:hypothetical protein